MTKSALNNPVSGPDQIEKEYKECEKEIDLVRQDFAMRGDEFKGKGERR